MIFSLEFLFSFDFWITRFKVYFPYRDLSPHRPYQELILTDILWFYQRRHSPSTITDASLDLRNYIIFQLVEKWLIFLYIRTLFIYFLQLDFYVGLWTTLKLYLTEQLPRRRKMFSLCIARISPPPHPSPQFWQLVNYFFSLSPIYLI